ncbi:cupin domain-containing protein [Georgenia sp. SYP-B2076]|uniref:cupin domain-containing protein n=1 Tax=Georgenia sp. SYP-B2076 TaxID=2495881 RepID=UPI000F8E6D85|nr:cupin domain-containing protein [Georgenia sp. SYP-B2076]
MEMDKDGGLVIDTDAMEWRTLAPGVGIKVLRLDRASQEWTIMIRSEKGSVLPPHQHIGNSEIYIIKGAGHHQQAGHFKTGDYVLEPDGATHSPLFFEEEVIQIMFAKGPSQFLDEDGNPTFLMDVDMLCGLAEEEILASA